MIWTAIWSVLVFVLALSLLLFHGDSILAFAAEQLRERRTHHLQLERERTKQARLGHDRDTLIWRELDDATSSEQAPEPRGTRPALRCATASRWPRRSSPRSCRGGVAGSRVVGCHH